ncbi:Zn(II)2Cys6 transcription factor domain-containing protein [Aspergillus ruber CBS 135680]|uniref:Putative Zn(II)2Cys6 transcription factor n=1 Tax=Aspergillus ruber (strain CBS 135680) TaxID=1388766 RepID=A0A017SFF0_ASPRC|nr:putative Zn(II)2Cys6 transcription factor [Aspergillus ruber CBS 135680]EYE95476.1 putative Zn(II)2Cys6 transcription factor [Aspergillus ruber CBS 135680]
MSSLTACDECFKRKRKCQVDSGSSQCLLCQRSSTQCTRTRRQKRVGRPPNPGPSNTTKGIFDIWDANRGFERAQSAQQPGLAEMISPSTLGAVSQRIPCTNDEGFYAALDIWMFGSTFAKDFHRAIHYCHRNSPWLLHEMFIAMDTFIGWARFNRTTSERVDMERGARSLQKLRTAEVTHAQDALAILMLGQALAAFDAFLTSRGATSILRYSLSLMKPWYSSFEQVQFLDPVTISPIFWDIACCLIYREIPIIQPGARDPSVIDRLAGLCPSVLPILYDLCVIGHNLRGDPKQTNQLNIIEKSVRQWTPDYECLQSRGFSAIEVASIRTQAIMYRTASLLLIHRLRHPLTCHDNTAVLLANDILTERNNFFAAQGNEATLQNVVLPLFLALLEVPCSPLEVWKSSTRLRVRTACLNTILIFHQFFWERKQSGFNGFLFDLIDNGPKFVPLP